MKRKHVILFLLGIVVIGISLFRGKNHLSAGGELAGIEPWAVCRDLPANAHWTGTNVSSDGLRKEIRQEEQSPNIWVPSLQPELFTGGQGTVEICTFECDTGYTWNVSSQVCEIPAAPGVPCSQAQDITISDGTNSYTIQACNLGATIAGTGAGAGIRDPSYGNYYQRGNNYGFPSSGTVITSTDQVSTTGSYTSGTFITNNGDWSSNSNDNLRGGNGDTQTNRTGRDADRKGPCPVGYHIPSAGEWGGLLTIRWNVISGDYVGSNDISFYANGGLSYVYDCANDCSLQNTIGMRFMDDFLLPLAGYRYYDSSATINYQGATAYYWSSSPNSTYARDLYFGPSIVSANSGHTRAYAFSLRCFQNSP